MRVPTSLESAFLLDSPGEYDVHAILVTGVRTFRDESKARSGASTPASSSSSTVCTSSTSATSGHLLTRG